MIKVYIDGASAGNPGLSGAGVFIKASGQTEGHSIPLGLMNNHEAEFHALIHALKICKKKQYPIVSMQTDSQLVENAIDKRYVRNKKYEPFLEEALPLIDSFELFFIKWIPSTQNKVADRLARDAIQKQIV